MGGPSLPLLWSLGWEVGFEVGMVAGMVGSGWMGGEWGLWRVLGWWMGIDGGLAEWGSVRVPPMGEPRGARGSREVGG